MENLLTIFIGMVAMALVIIAAGIGAVAWYLVKLIAVVTTLLRRLHEAGEVVAEDLVELKGALATGGIAQFIYQLTKTLWPKKKIPRKSPPPQE
jgi:hypothetical protein